MNAIPYPVVAADLGANDDGTIYTNTGAIITVRSLFCEAIDLLRIQDPKQYERIVRDLKPTAGQWTDPKDILTRKTNLRTGGRPFNFVWQALNSNMSCNLEDEHYLVNEVQSQGGRQINMVLHNRTMPESMLVGIQDRPAKDIVNLETYFAAVRGAIIKDAANLNGAVHITLEIPAPKGK